MIIESNISKYIVFAEDGIAHALRKMTLNRSRTVFCVGEHGTLEGVLTDGDFRRWIVEEPEIDLDQPVSRIVNREFRSASVRASPDEIRDLFDDGVTLIPLTDDRNRIVSIALRAARAIELGDFTIGSDAPAFVIAEIGINHNGSIELARRLVDEAVLAGADCVKFQMRYLPSLYRNSGDPNDLREDLGSQYILDILSRFSLSNDELFETFDYARAQGVLPLCTPWDEQSVLALENYGIDGYKIASADLTNHDLLRFVAATRKPMLVSTGMSTENEIKQSVSLLRDNGVAFVLLHCNSTYPAPLRDIHLSFLDGLAEIGDCPVGYSGHERGIAVPVAAVALGARVIEKHFTLDKTMEGNDHKVSLLPHEFRTMVDSIRQVEAALSKQGERRPSQGEFINRENLAKSLMATRQIEAGETITDEMLISRSPGRGLQPNYRKALVGRPARRSIKPGDFFYGSDLDDVGVKPRAYRFRRPWGLPVRYHDFQNLLGQSNMDFLEFHLSYKDMEQEPSRFFDRPLDLGITVHSPDLFSGDHLIDLAARDEGYRLRSVRELQRVVNTTRELSAFFSRSSKPLIIASLGGFTKEHPLAEEERPELYEMVATSLDALDKDGVEIVPQTVPPFPWYLGGQLHCNIFVDPVDTATFCETYGYRICLDLSHSKLATNCRNASFKEFVEAVGPYVAHIHVSDAEGLDGEGLQIGMGEIDFAVVAEQLDVLAPSAGFIPEVWQGHKNDGEGFWVALDRLERWF
ncbi:MAG: N-acetylneuraminate synthase family protein [Actinobacteria bacterium]|nr:N-acetylneuraminate synthase family protein [Actinomycetota bacterium]